MRIREDVWYLPAEIGNDVHSEERSANQRTELLRKHFALARLVPIFRVSTTFVGEFKADVLELPNDNPPDL